MPSPSASFPTRRAARSLLPAPAVALLLAAAPASGQWSVENYPLVAGWNAVWLSVDATGHLPSGPEDRAPIDIVLSGPEVDPPPPPVPAEQIEEIWAWNPLASTAQFTQSPAAPVQPDSQWRVWRRGQPATSTLAALPANAAYLVKVADGAAPFTLSLTGRPVPPRYAWSSSGLNFFGFPMQEPALAGVRSFETFLSLGPDPLLTPDIFRYVGGPLNPGVNPSTVSAPRTTPVVRGQAYWIRSNSFSDYYGPLRVSVAQSGLDFGDTGSALAVRLTNRTGSALTATLENVASATPPAGQPAVAGVVRLLLRGALDPATGLYPFAPLTASTPPVSLAAGESVELVLAVDRAEMGGSAGDVFASVLRLTDSRDQTRIDLPVRAVTTSRAGLWIGAATVGKVDQVTAAPAPQADGTANVLVSTQADASTPAPFPLRLLFHRDSAGAVRLLQRVYIGSGRDNPEETVVATSEGALAPSRLADARRLSSSVFPLGAVYAGTGDLGLSGTLTCTASLDLNDRTNPFLHAYHPDHDNRPAGGGPTFVAGSPAAETPTVQRVLSFTFAADPAAVGIDELGWGSTALGGTFKETITGLRAQPVSVSGTFVLYRVSGVPELAQ